MSSVFDSYLAPPCLLYDEDETIISTDHVFDEVLGIKRVNPRDLVKRVRLEYR